MTSDDYSTLLSGTCWENASEQCRDWQEFQDEIESATSMSQCASPMSGKGLLQYLSRSDAVSEKFRKKLDDSGFMYYKLFTMPKVAQKQREKLHKTKLFKKHVGKRKLLNFLFQSKN